MKKNESVIFPEYWAKRRSKMNPKLVKEVEETAKAKAVEVDQFGEYKPGTFLHRDCIVTIKRENDLWCMHIYCEHSIGFPMIEEIRYKYLPDYALMAYMLNDRETYNQLKGYLLYEIPQEEKESPVEEKAE